MGDEIGNGGVGSRVGVSRESWEQEIKFTTDGVKGRHGCKREVSAVSTEMH